MNQCRAHFNKALWSPVTVRQKARLELKRVDSSWPERTSLARRRFTQGWGSGVVTEARTDTVCFLPISEVCDGTVSLLISHCFTNTCMFNLMVCY